VRRLFIAKALLQALQKIAQNLILATPIMLMPWFTEQGCQFVLAKREPCLLKEGQDIVGLKIQRNSQLHQDHIVGQMPFRGWLRVFAATTSGIDPTVKEDRHLHVINFLITGVGLLLEPGTNLLSGHRMIGTGKHVDHVVVIQIEDVTNSAQHIVMCHER